MGLVAYDKHNVGRNLVPPLIPFLLECDFCASLPSGLHVDREHLVLFASGAVGLQHLPRYLHLLRAALGDILQRHVQVVFDGGVLQFVLAAVGAVHIERVAAKGASGAPQGGGKGIVDVHVVVVETEHAIAAPQVEEGLERAGVAEELGEGGSWVAMELVRVEGRTRVGPPWDSALQPFLAVGVVHVPFLLVRQHLVGLGDLFEPVFSPWGFIFVGMILQGQLPVGLLDVIVCRPTGNSQDLVIVLPHRRLSR